MRNCLIKKPCGISGRDYDYKTHAVMNDIIIEKLSVTPANVNDSLIDLGLPGIICKMDEVYYVSECKE